MGSVHVVRDSNDLWNTHEKLNCLRKMHCIVLVFETYTSMESTPYSLSHYMIWVSKIEQQNSCDVCSDGDGECGDSDGGQQGGPGGQERSSSPDCLQSRWHHYSYITNSWRIAQTSTQVVINLYEAHITHAITYVIRARVAQPQVPGLILPRHSFYFFHLSTCCIWPSGCFGPWIIIVA